MPVTRDIMLEEMACPSMPKHNLHLHARTTEIGRWLLKMGPPPERPNPQTARPRTTSCPLNARPQSQIVRPQTLLYFWKFNSVWSCCASSCKWSFPPAYTPKRYNLDSSNTEKATPYLFESPCIISLKFLL